MTTAYLNRIATAVPPNDVHDAFIRFAEAQLKGDRRKELLFRRMAEKGGIEHRYSYFRPANDMGGDVLDADAFFVRGRFPRTAERMRFFEAHAPRLAAEAVERLELGEDRKRITHLLITCCTGLSSPGLDLELIDRCGLRPDVERTILGFMGCYAAINALKLARHIVRSDPDARVLILSLELCTLHLKETAELEEVLTFLLWGDGAAAALVTAEPKGASLDSFRAVLAPNTRELMTWGIRDAGFDMLLSGQVPAAIQDTLGAHVDKVLEGRPVDSIDLWAVHPGGRSVLDAVERALDVGPTALSASREVLRRFGNMSSATVMFVMDSLLRSAPAGAAGCAMSFGPGLVAETMLFQTVGA
jgi:predicted naringenin-chalcone synthase